LFGTDRFEISVQLKNVKIRVNPGMIDEMHNQIEQA